MIDLLSLLRAELNRVLWRLMLWIVALLALISAWLINLEADRSQRMVEQFAKATIRSSLLQGDWLGVQREISRFSGIMTAEQALETALRVRVDSRLVAQTGDDWHDSEFNVKRTIQFTIESGQKVELTILIRFGTFLRKVAFAGLIVTILFSVIHWRMRLALKRTLDSAFAPMKHTIDWINSIASSLPDLLGVPKPPMHEGAIQELHVLEGAVISLVKEIHLLEKKLADTAYLDGQVALARQVAHDIRSPLSALNMIAIRGKSLETDLRDVMSTTVKRLNEIVDSLMAKEKVAETRESDEITDICRIVPEIVAEKRVEFANRSGLVFVEDLPDEKIFCRISGTELKRALSNLINNSVESISQSGEVHIGVRSYSGGISIVLRDTGKGIRADVLDRVGERGFSAGKDRGASGSGLGVNHAKELMKRAGGQLHIASQEGVGTVVTLNLPLARSFNS